MLAYVGYTIEWNEINKLLYQWLFGNQLHVLNINNVWKSTVVLK